nr:hypothetical protein [Escherichia coli]
MFVFFAKHPGSNPNQGMHHRILAIDNIVRDKERKYVHVSFFKNLRRKITQIDAKTVLPVVNTQGQPCGTLHFQDLLEEA